LLLWYEDEFKLLHSNMVTWIVSRIKFKRVTPVLWIFCVLQVAWAMWLFKYRMQVCSMPFKGKYKVLMQENTTRYT
jgi:hypothetical protein